jgi:hypothetical protein
MEELKSKGINFRGALGALQRRHGKATCEAVLARVQGPAGEALRHGEVLAGGWYPASWYDALLAAIEEHFDGDRNVVRELSRQAIVDDFSTLFKLVSLVVSPESALTTASRITSRYVQGGRITVVERREGAVHYRFEDYFGYTRRMWSDWLGGMEAILEMMKVKRLPPRILGGGGDGDAHFELVIRYSK